MEFLWFETSDVKMRETGNEPGNIFLFHCIKIETGRREEFSFAVGGVESTNAD